MKLLLNYILLQLLFNSFTLTTSQWCVSFKSVIKSRVQWNNGQRLVSKRNFFGGIKYKYEPYVYSTIQNYHDYERVSVCCEGYKTISDTKCEPICDPSCPSNTHCLRPNICECDLGYRGYTASPYTIICEPTCAPACGKNAECTEPNICSCNKGYSANSSEECEPICKDCPAYSSCHRPDQCECNDGYIDNGWGLCKALCTEQCPDKSECTEPDICTCQQNYEMKNGKCEPICEEKCPQNSKCIKPNECDCLEGYEKVEQVNASSFKCLAKCVQGCPLHATCSQPNVCECEQGYEKSQQNTCEPICQTDCSLHSTCSEPNKCTCDKGYEMIEQQCQPVCEKACPEHSNCSEPNKCQCEAGYLLKLSSIYNLYCEPICQSNCSSFGKCVQPNKCECLEGYEMDVMEVCQPICRGGCKNGLCFQPDICICKPGYLMGPQEECEPVCSMPCQNGSCVEPEICQCNPGFIFKINSINVCEPICEPMCVNGICVDPNVCICHENYEPIKTEEGLNHNICELIQTTTITTTITDEIEDITAITNTNEITESYFQNSNEIMTTISTSDSFTSFHSDLLKQTTSSSLAPADICNDHCQCWQEFDEFGPLISKQCTKLCVDSFDRPCLDLSFCQCDVNRNNLVCRSSQDSLEQDDPLYYMCNLERFKATTFKPTEESKSSDMKSVQANEKSNFPWYWVGIAVAVFSTLVIGGLLYLHFKKVEDPIMEYEL